MKEARPAASTLVVEGILVGKAEIHLESKDTVQRSGQSTDSDMAFGSEQAWVEYEGVLTNAEQYVLDVVDYAARRICPFKACCVGNHAQDGRSSNSSPVSSIASPQTVTGIVIDDDTAEQWTPAGGESQIPAPTSNNVSDAYHPADIEGCIERGNDRYIDRSRGDSQCRDQRDASVVGKAKRFSWWEGMREDVPERYQRWEGIRERNAILGMLFGFFGYKRKQPTLAERVHLFFLYAAIWYFCYAFTLRRRGDICRKSWVDTCVPLHLLGGCNESCASEAVLAQTPAPFNDYAGVSRNGHISIPMENARCIASGAAASVCEVPMCVARSSSSCLRSEDGVTGFCYCDENRISLLLFEMLVYTVLQKIIHLPFWYLFVRDLRKISARLQCVATSIVIPLYVLFFVFGADTMWRYFHSLEGWISYTLYWLASFVLLCCFEVVKSFTIGHIVGCYVIRPSCPALSRVWQFVLS